MVIDGTNVSGQDSLLAAVPNMVVKKVTKLHTGRIGFYVADTSGGDFANIKITRGDRGCCDRDYFRRKSR